MQKVCPFRIGSIVMWVPKTPETWRYIYTPGPMRVIDARYHDGTPSEYAKMFGPNGMNITPGWILTVEYGADSTNYYNPPLSLLLGKKRIAKEVHQKWLIKILDAPRSRITAESKDPKNDFGRVVWEVPGDIDSQFRALPEEARNVAFMELSKALGAFMFALVGDLHQGPRISEALKDMEVTLKQHAARWSEEAEKGPTIN